MPVLFLSLSLRHEVLVKWRRGEREIVYLHEINMASDTVNTLKGRDLNNDKLETQLVSVVDLCFIYLLISKSVYI